MTRTVTVTGQPPLWLRLRKLGYDPSDILNHFGITSPPVPVFDLAKGLGVSLLKRSEMPERGRLDVDLEVMDAVIRVRAEDSARGRRFTVAHELGHLFLHRLNEAKFRDRNFKGESPTEVEANRFAARLLMPDWMLESYGIHKATHDIAGAADVFDVSRQAMSLRLDGMLRLNDRWL